MTGTIDAGAAAQAAIDALAIVAPAVIAVTVGLVFIRIMLRFIRGRV